MGVGLALDSPPDGARLCIWHTIGLTDAQAGVYECWNQPDTLTLVAHRSRAPLACVHALCHALSMMPEGQAFVSEAPWP